MANSMDSILVKFGTKDIDREDYSEHPEIKTVTLPEFLNIEPNELSEDERKIQEAVHLVYRFNEEKSFYKGFPTLDPQKPLTINCTGKYDTPGDAVFAEELNEIGFENRRVDGTLLAKSLVHELKHAEQVTDSEIRKIKDENDNRKSQELLLLQEVDANLASIQFAVEFLKSKPDSLEKKYSELIKTNTDTLTVRQEMVPVIIEGRVLHPLAFNVYRHQIELRWPIRDEDVGLQTMPKYFNLPDASLDVFKSISCKPKTDEGKAFRYLVNNQEDKVLSVFKNEVQKEKMLNLFLDDFYVDKEEYEGALHKLIYLTDKDGSSLFDKSVLVDVFKNSIQKENNYFEGDLKIIQDENGMLPFIKEDFIDEAGKSIFKFPRGIKSYPVLLKLKGKDGQPLINQEDVVKNLPRWFEGSTPDNIQKVFDAIKDENGNLPFSRKLLDTVEYIPERYGKGYSGAMCGYVKGGKNILLNELETEMFFNDNEQENKDALKKIDIIMGLKDKDGLPIVSAENIEKFCIKDKEILSAVKSCAASRKEEQKPVKIIQSKHSVKDTEKINQIIKARRNAVKDY